MLNIVLIGAGRIGRMHAQNIFLHPKCNLSFVYDVNQKSATDIANKYNSKVASSVEEAINNKATDVVFIASATPTHPSTSVVESAWLPSDSARRTGSGSGGADCAMRVGDSAGPSARGVRRVPTRRVVCAQES